MTMFESRSVGKIFKGKNIEKGMAFPTSISINKLVEVVNAVNAMVTVCSVAGHFCPVESDVVLQNGDVVKVYAYDV